MELLEGGIVAHEPTTTDPAADDGPDIPVAVAAAVFKSSKAAALALTMGILLSTTTLLDVAELIRVF